MTKQTTTNPADPRLDPGSDAYDPEVTLAGPHGPAPVQSAAGGASASVGSPGLDRDPRLSQATQEEQTADGQAERSGAARQTETPRQRRKRKRKSGR
jgi:hypothetical protein